MSPLDELEALKLLKARYCRLLDAKDWTGFRALFTDDDFVSDTTGAGGQMIHGGDAFVAIVRGYLGDASKVTVHHVHAPELELLSETEARGVWAMEDLVKFAPGFSMRGYGHYHESYRKQGGQWRISASKLTRLREDIVTPLLTFQLGDGLRQMMSRAAARSQRAGK